MSRYYKATEVDEFLNIFGKGNCNLCAFYDECNPRGLDGEGSHRYCWQAKRFPTADVTEVVRYKDCKYAKKSKTVLGVPDYSCLKTDITYLDADDFCNYGERKDENDDR